MEADAPRCREACRHGDMARGRRDRSHARSAGRWPLVKVIASASAVLLLLFALTPASATELPNRVRTPGAVATSSTAVVCRPGHAHAVRNVSYRVRDAVYTAYGLPRGRRTPGGGYVGPRRGYVIDHLVPLELGGANDPRNLWPQPRAEARAKDRVEDTLHEAVCSGQMGLVDAQQRIVRDWERAVPASVRLSNAQRAWIDRPRGRTTEI